MKKALYNLLFIALFFTVITSCSGDDTENVQTELTTIILVRHAEQLNLDPNSPLTPQGAHRANELALQLSSTQIDAVYSTPFLRTLSTVEPLCNQKGLTPIIYQRNEYSGCLQRIMGDYKGKVVLVCGHEETIPAMLNLLVGEDKYTQLADDDYNHIYYSITDKIGKSEILVKTYGQ